jgi:hypothetical protein
MKRHNWNTVRDYLAGVEASPGVEARPGAWPRQFSLDYCTVEDLEYFKRAIHRIADLGYSWEQIQARLLYLRNESDGGAKLNRNQILRDLKQQAADQARDRRIDSESHTAQPRQERRRSIGPVATYIRDPEQCARMFPWFDPTAPEAQKQIGRYRQLIAGEDAGTDADAAHAKVREALGPNYQTPPDVRETLERLKTGGTA